MCIDTASKSPAQYLHLFWIDDRIIDLMKGNEMNGLFSNLVSKYHEMKLNQNLHCYCMEEDSKSKIIRNSIKASTCLKSRKRERERE
jgi:ribosomal protein S1